MPTRPKGCGDLSGGQGGRGPAVSTRLVPSPLGLDGDRQESRGVGVAGGELAGCDTARGSRDSDDGSIPGCVKALSSSKGSSDGGSSSGSLSPDLLRRYPTGATGDVLEDLAPRSAVAGSRAADQGAAGSDESDSWPDSSDLLGGYLCGEGKGLLEVSTRAIGAGETETTGKRTILGCRPWSLESSHLIYFEHLLFAAHCIARSYAVCGHHILYLMYCEYLFCSTNHGAFVCDVYICVHFCLLLS